MKRKGFFSDFNKIKSVSFGLVYIFFTLWLIFHTGQYVPAEQQSFWFMIFISYGILQAVVFGNADLRNKLFNVKLVDFAPRFALFFIGGLVFFYAVLANIQAPGLDFFDVLKGVPLWLTLIHLLVFATTESVIWQGYLDGKIGQPWSALSAGVFHYGIWSGGAIVVILSAGLLFMMFSAVNWYFRKNQNDLSPVIGVHTAFNVVKLGIFVSVGGNL